jgi:phage terminase large subunit-like protein
LLLDTAAQDGKRVRIGFNQTQGRPARAKRSTWSAWSAAYREPGPRKRDKLTRFGPFSSQCRAGNVKIRRRSWNEEVFRALEGFAISPMTTRSTPAAAPWKCSIPNGELGPF